MKRKIELMMALLLLVGVLIVSQKLSQYVSGEKVIAKKEEYMVIVDAGHGGEDPGKVGVNDCLEKDLNLKIAKKVQEKLEKNKVQVIMTRTSDRMLANTKIADMKERVSIMNKKRPVLAISIHQNSYQDGTVKGAQVFYYAHSSEGEKAAQIMQEALQVVDAENTRKVKANDTYYLLKKTKVPTVIVECGFLSNQEEAQQLKTEEYQEKIAASICEGAIQYMKN
ncbi:MAG: N-acetylmuramoyl-L-alanine amidase [Lachnospiraceae bacterium]